MNTLFLVALVVEALFGIGFLFAPGAMLGPFGVTFNDIATTYTELKGKGVEFLDEPAEFSEGMYARFRDPFGNVHELIEFR